MNTYYKVLERKIKLLARMRKSFNIDREQRQWSHHFHIALAANSIIEKTLRMKFCPIICKGEKKVNRVTFYWEQECDEVLEQLPKSPGSHKDVI